MALTMAHDATDAFVFFGATGDLAYRHIFPALQALIRRRLLDMPIIGVARSATGIDALRSRARESLEMHGGVDPSAFATLSSRLQCRLARAITFAFGSVQTYQFHWERESRCRENPWSAST